MAPDGKTVAELHAQNPDSLWQFLAGLPASFEAQILYALILFGLVGMAGNYTLKWAREEIEGNLICYLFVQYPRRTVLSFSSFLGLAITALTTGVFMHEGQFVGWLNVLWVAITTGFSVDVAANKGERPKWTNEKRSAVAVVQKENDKSDSVTVIGGTP